jgi:peptidoglycan/xylan/chitin deacetylase (PgdA/CDA1 family)
VALSADVEIGAHSMTHPLLSTLTTEQSREEIVDSKHYLEALLKKPITCFCYPSGDYTKEHVDQVRSAGFTLARTTKRFHLERSSTLLEMPTSIHAYRHWSDMWDIAKFSRGNPIAFFRYLFHWDALAIAMFDRVLSSGGVFHLWGHSWEIEKNGHWQALQRVLRHISGRAGVSYLPNSALI